MARNDKRIDQLIPSTIPLTGTDLIAIYNANGTRNQTLDSVTNFVAATMTGITSNDTYVTGATLNVNTLELGRNQGLVDLSVDLSTLSAFVHTASGRITPTNAYGNTVDGNYSSVLGGKSNTITNSVYSSIGGGFGNSITGTSMASIVGGNNNIVSGTRSFVGGGYGNSASGDDSLVVGGFQNSATTYYSSVVGGQSNSASGPKSFVGGGYGNSASGDNSAVVGGIQNSATTRSFVGGGYGNSASGKISFIGGGQSNLASGYMSLVVGGQSNSASGTRSFVGGGYGNSASGDNSAVIGGSLNDISGIRSVILGGQSISGATNDTVYVPDLVIKKSAAVPTSTADSVGEDGSITWDNNGFIYWKTPVGWLRTSGSTF